MWREERADRLEAVVLTDLFAAGKLPDPAEAEAAKTAAFKALGTLLRYRGRIEREHRAAMQALECLRQRRLARPVARPDEPEPALPMAAPPPAAAPAAAVPVTTVPATPHAATGSAAERTRARPRPEPPPAPRTRRHGPPPRRLICGCSSVEGRGRQSAALAEPARHGSSCYGRRLDNGQALGRIA